MVVMKNKMRSKMFWMQNLGDCMYMCLFCRVGGQSTIYRWPLRQTEEEKKEEQRAIAAQKVISPAQEARVDAVTHNLVQWGRELVRAQVLWVILMYLAWYVSVQGGSEKSCDIDEPTVKSLFASDHETRVSFSL